MTSQPVVSVVMAVYNGKEFLREAIESILDQTFRNFEFVIINDGSVDGTDAILDDYARLSAHLRVYRQSNQGLITSLNTACQLARGTYIARMDADDIAFPDRLERQVSFLMTHANVAVLGGAAQVIDRSGRPISLIRYPTTNSEIKAALFTYSCFVHPTVMMSKDAFLALGGYRKPFLHAEEYDLWLRMAERYELGNLADPVLYYRVHPQQITTSHLEQQVVSALGARAAACVRQTTGRDPFSNTDVVNQQLLHQLGLDARLINKSLIQAFLFVANRMLEADADEVAFRFVKQALARSGTSYISKSTFADLYWGIAAQQYQKGHWVRCLRPLLCACLMQPWRVRTLAKTHLYKFLGLCRKACSLRLARWPKSRRRC